MPSDDEKVERLIREGVLEAEAPDAYKDVVRGLTPDELEIISSVNKQLQQVADLSGERADFFFPWIHF